MALELTDEVRAFFQEPTIFHLAMVRADGSPQVAPVWAAVEGNRILISTGENSPKIKALRHDPRVAMSATRISDPYLELHLRGHVVEINQEDAIRRMNAISNRYIGADFPLGLAHQVNVYIEVEHVTTRKIPLTANS